MVTELKVSAITEWPWISWPATDLKKTRMVWHRIYKAQSSQTWWGKLCVWVRERDCLTLCMGGKIGQTALFLQCMRTVESTHTLSLTLQYTHPHPKKMQWNFSFHVLLLINICSKLINPFILLCNHHPHTTNLKLKTRL